MLRRLLFSLLLLMPAAVLCAGPPDPRIADHAWAAEGGTAPVLVMLRERADLSPAALMPDRIDRRRFVHLALRDTAARSQADLRALLDGRGIPHRSFFIVNCVRLDADRALLAELAQRHDVERIVADPLVRRDPTLPPPLAKAAQWNVGIIGAPAAWAGGFHGEGIVVGVQDTGMRWTHEALRPKYRGFDAATGLAQHDRHWHDAIHAGGNGGPCGTDAREPCDDDGHGTHVTATVVGGDPAADAFGVAPGAGWIGCRNMDVGWGSPSTYLECFEFFLAPTDLSGDPATGDPTFAPDVTSNSWACPPAEGCAWDVLQPAVDAHRAAGILTVAAAGNSGPGCGSLADPPAILGGAYTVGASDSADGVAGFSSRGPAGSTGLIKPDIMAPGVGIRSATAAADDAYDAWSGTSMAAPHVAGAVALLWSARPAYRGRIDETEALLNRTALRLSAVAEGCGGDDVAGPNATWGHGRIDLALALAEACAPSETGCANLFDDDCDGLMDCDDADCSGTASCPEAGRCTEGMDDDLDTLIDCDDPDCAGDAACPETGHCSDGIDNDLDGEADCADGGCAGDAACPETGHCTDGVDNDLDILADCGDTDCAGDPACPEAGNCADGVDNDLDALTDCADPGCSGNTACPESAACADGLDNDADGLADCLDDDCLGDASCPEAAACANGRDDDLDGLRDCADPDCAGDPACPEALNCADGVDNDLDGPVDCGDSDCASGTTCAGDDFDGDGAANASDCAPLDPGAWELPGEVSGLRVTRTGGSLGLEWAATGASQNDVASGDIGGLRRGASGACIATGLAAPSFVDAAPVATDCWYLVRASNSCGASPQGWGLDSRGGARPDCP